MFQIPRFVQAISLILLGLLCQNCGETGFQKQQVRSVDLNSNAKLEVSLDDQTVLVEDPVIMTASLSLPVENPGFRWYRGDVLLAETDIPRFYFENASLSHAGVYRVVVLSGTVEVGNDSAVLQVRERAPGQPAPTVAAPCSGAEVAGTSVYNARAIAGINLRNSYQVNLPQAAHGQEFQIEKLIVKTVPSGTRYEVRHTLKLRLVCLNGEYKPLAGSVRQILDATSFSGISIAAAYTRVRFSLSCENADCEGQGKAASAFAGSRASGRLVAKVRKK